MHIIPTGDTDERIKAEGITHEKKQKELLLPSPTSFQSRVSEWIDFNKKIPLLTTVLNVWVRTSGIGL